MTDYEIDRVTEVGNATLRDIEHVLSCLQNKTIPIQDARNIVERKADEARSMGKIGEDRRSTLDRLEQSVIACVNLIELHPDERLDSAFEMVKPKIANFRMAWGCR